MKDYKPYLCVILIIVQLFLSGCWSHRELNEIGIVSGMGFDLSEEGNVILTVQIITPMPASGKSSINEKDAVRILSAEGETVFDAVRYLMTISGDRLFYPHNQIIVIGEEFARAGIRPIFDFIERDPELRVLTWTLLTEGKAGDIIRAPSKEEIIPAMHLARLIEDYEATSKSIPSSILQISNYIDADGIEPAIGKVYFRYELGEPTFHMEGGGAFKNDKLIGWLDDKEARGYLWVHNDVKSGIITATIPGSQNQEQEKGASGNSEEELLKRISFEIIRTKTKVKPVLEGEQLSFVIDVKATCNIGERVDHKETPLKQYEELEKILGQKVIEEIQLILDKAQKELKTDILGFGQATYKKYPKYWKEHKEDWDDIFPNLDVEILVEPVIADHGQVN